MRNKIRVWIFSLFLLNLFSSLAQAQLPDFVDMVKNNGSAVVNISTTQKLLQEKKMVVQKSNKCLKAQCHRS